MTENIDVVEAQQSQRLQDEAIKPADVGIGEAAPHEGDGHAGNDTMYVMIHMYRSVNEH